IELDELILARRDSLGHIFSTLSQPAAETEVWRDLQTFGLPWWRKQGIPQAVGHRDIRRDLPRILYIHFVAVGPEVPLYGCPLRKHAAVFQIVIGGIHFRHNPCQCNHWKIV